MNGPLSFHNNPPTMYRPRHRNRNVTSQVMVDTYGNEHMILTFYVQGKPDGWTPSPSDMSLLERTNDWAYDNFEKLSKVTLDESFEWSKEKADVILDGLRDLFRYLNGMERTVMPSLPPVPRESNESRKKDEKRAWNFAGIFSSLRGPKTGGEMVRPRSQTFTEGEVHADLIRVWCWSCVFKMSG